MSHPKTQAERRHYRHRSINRGIAKASFLHWFSKRCTCWPHGSIFRPECDWHGEATLTERRKIGAYAKTPPYDWIRAMETDWFLSGTVRRDYRSGGGRRAQEWGLKTGKYAGRFNLKLALREWNDKYDIVDMSDQDIGAGEWHGSTLAS